ncbi:hypothetical protein ONZ51_g4342 [Trametes cubensis]|uniref:Uncharacterized protein n=1 Tax=Trametes cubensis TaxID=1111947 RepID=A0AAD7XD38_9APHY|nr:hypothetical protein ONZ51_g4342 [Trametes cubensis]
MLWPFPPAIATDGPPLPIPANQLVCNSEEEVWLACEPVPASVLLDSGSELLLYDRLNHWKSCNAFISYIVSIHQNWATLALRSNHSSISDAPTNLWLCVATTALVPAFRRSVFWRILRPFRPRPRSFLGPGGSLNADVLRWLSSIDQALGRDKFPPYEENNELASSAVVKLESQEESNVSVPIFSVERFT